MERIDRSEGYPYMTPLKEKEITLTECLKKCVLNQSEAIRQLREDKARLVEALKETSEYLTHIDKNEFERDELNNQLIAEMEAKNV
jgi:hypothetical protein